jgi:predicted HicB family RNase H-like nuclease
MKHETQSIFYCIRINPSLHKAIRNEATAMQKQPSKLIREMLTDKFTQSGTLKKD